MAVVVVGIAEGEGYDRSSLDLPGEQERLIGAVAATGTPTVVVLVNGSAVTMGKWIAGVPLVLECWYGGEEAGNAVADVLFGAKNPGGKLPITFPQVVGQVPLFYNAKPTGRLDGYVDMSGKPLFPFGHGLSYTTFAYSDLRLTPGKLAPDGSCRVSLSVRNSGPVTGDEVVQLYIRRPVASVTRPVKELKGFSRITLAPGETTRSVHSLARRALIPRRGDEECGGGGDRGSDGRLVVGGYTAPGEGRDHRTVVFLRGLHTWACTGGPVMRARGPA